MKLTREEWLRGESIFTGKEMTVVSKDAWNYYLRKHFNLMYILKDDRDITAEILDITEEGKIKVKYGRLSPPTKEIKINQTEWTMEEFMNKFEKSKTFQIMLKELEKKED